MFVSEPIHIFQRKFWIYKWNSFCDTVTSKWTFFIPTGLVKQYGNIPIISLSKKRIEQGNDDFNSEVCVVSLI